MGSSHREPETVPGVLQEDRGGQEVKKRNSPKSTRPPYPLNLPCGCRSTAGRYTEVILTDGGNRICKHGKTWALKIEFVEIKK